MTTILSNSVVEPSSELADELTEPILEAIRSQETDEAARAIIAMIRTLAHEEDPELREAFATDLAMRIFARTEACRNAAMAFAA
jgi:hypothetical protein